MWDRRRTVSLALAATAAAVLALAGCSDGGDDQPPTDPPARSGQPVRTDGPEPGTPSGSPPPSGVTGAGDLRALLLPVPEGGQPYGDAAGTAATLSEAAVGFGDDAEASLRRYGFEQGALRAYRTADGRQEVNVKLLRFPSEDRARGFADEVAFEGSRVPLPGLTDVRATLLDSAAAESTDALIAVGTEGEVQYTITVTSTERPRAEELAALVKRQEERLEADG